MFKCSGSCVSFLAEQKFDFNKLFSRGVSCCTQDVAVKLREKYDERQKSREQALEDALEVRDEKPSNNDDVPIPPEEVDKLTEVKYVHGLFILFHSFPRQINLFFNYGLDLHNS